MSTTSTPIVTDHPDITDEQHQAILAGLPKCPECGGDIYEVHFIAHQTHRFEIQVDGFNGDVLATSELHDVLDIEPAGIWALDLGVDRFSVSVECESQHQWLEPRLKLTRLEGSEYATWEVLPAEVQP